MASFIYVRVSSEQQQQSGASESSQIDLMRDLLKRLDMDDEPTIYRDLAVCRETANDMRSGLSAMLSVVRTGDVIALMKWDRLGTIYTAPALLERLRNIGVRVVTTQGEDTSTPHGEFMVNTLLNVAQLELRQIRERTSHGLQAMKRKGERYCRRVFGFDAVNGNLVPNESEQSTIRRIICDRDELGLTLAQIAEDLATEGITPPEGGRWHPSTISRIIKRAQASQVA